MLLRSFKIPHARDRHTLFNIKPMEREGGAGVACTAVFSSKLMLQLLIALCSCLLVAVCLDEQIVDKVPLEDHDSRVDM
jgi:hypothetical protein